MFDFSVSPSLLLPCALLLSCLLYSLLIRKRPSALPDLPWITRNKSEWFSQIRARLRNTSNYQAAVEDAYGNYSKHERSCIVATIDDTFIVLPASSSDWIISQQDHVLSAIEAQRASLQFDRTFPDPILSLKPTHIHTINTGLTRQLGNLTIDIMDEISNKIDETWGTDTVEWKTIPSVFESIMALVAGVTNRAFVGLPMCRNQSLLSSAAGFTVAVPAAAGVLNLTPKLLQPLVSAIVTIPNRLYFRTYKNTLSPEVRRRLTEYEKRSADLEKKAPDSEPNDFLQWHINHAKKIGDMAELDPGIIAGRILMLNFAAIHTTTFSATNLIFDVLGSDPKLRVIEQLHEEIENVLAAEGGKWTKRGVQNLVKMDSTLRESQRVNTFLGLGLARKVIAPEGITTPDGIHCPHGSMIALSAYGIHFDPSIYPEPNVFKPFRFSDLRQQIEHDTDGLIKKANLGFVTTSGEYMPFGHGRHACPGRFFAANELKLILAYILLNYEFEPIPVRPPGRWFATVRLPPMKAGVRVRRRQARTRT